MIMPRAAGEHRLRCDAAPRRAHREHIAESRLLLGMPQRLIGLDCHDRGVVGQFRQREAVPDRFYAAPRGPARLAVAFAEGGASRVP